MGPRSPTGISRLAFDVNPAAGAPIEAALISLRYSQTYFASAAAGWQGLGPGAGQLPSRATPAIRVGGPAGEGWFYGVATIGPLFG